MKREIKFRGKRIDNGEWIYGSLINNDVIVGDIVEWDSEYFCTEFWLKVDPKTVGQLTGLKDRNGKEIYEGDIINDSFGDRKGRIRYNIHIVAFEIADYDGIHLLSSHNSEKYFEVIGNIYEHPHLIGKGETA